MMSTKVKTGVVMALLVAATGAGALIWLGQGAGAGAGAGAIGTAAGAVAAGSKLDGKALYLAQCASCHGADLKGQPNWRSTKADGRLPAPPHDASGHTWHHNDDLLFRITKFGSAKIIGGDYKSDMMAFKDVLRDEQIIAVLDYIKSTWPRRMRNRQARLSKKNKPN